MLKITRGQKGSAVLISLSGVVDDAADLNALIGEPPPELHVHCAYITRFNSVGVKAWISYFENAERRGTKLAFYDCSPVVVEQINMIVNFIGSGRVVSIQMPFSCQTCGNRYTTSAKVEDLKKRGTVVPDEKCPKCGGFAEFEDLAEDYLGFMERQDEA